MTHLYIEQATDRTEEVNSSIISKLYELAISGDLDNTSDLKGRLHSSTAKDIHITYLNSNFEDLYITADKLYVTFTDPEVERVLMATEHIGDGTGISLADCATYGDYTVYGAPYYIFKGNTTIEYFPEFKYFTYWINKVNANPGLSNHSFDGCTNLKNIDITGMTVIPSACFVGCSLSEFNLQLLLGITSIGTFAFLNSGISGEINLPKLYDTGPNIFNDCDNITKVLSLGSITELKSNSFNSCGSLTQVLLPATCTSLGDNSLCDCPNLATIAEEGGLITTGSLILPDITYLDSNVFRGSAITSADFTGSTFTKLGQGSLSNCINLTTVTLPSTCTELGNSAFSGCTNLSTVIESGSSTTNVVSLPHLSKIGDYAFLNTHISSFDLPSSVTEIGRTAFAGCTQLTSIDLSNTQIASVSMELFKNCSNLQTIKLPATVINVRENWYPGQGSLKIIGLDNVSTHSEYNWLIINKSILNPIKDSLGTSGAIVRNTGNNTVTSIHSLYEPIRVSTPVGTRDGSFNVSGWLVYASGGNAIMNIGLLYLRDISSFGYVTFYRCNITNLVINNVTPPTHSTNSSLSSDEYYPSWGNSIFGDLTSSGVGMKAFIGTLWVPDSAVATYLADPQYSGLTIKGINTKTNGVDYDLPRYADFSAWEAAEEAAVAQGGHAPQGLIESWM